MQEKISNGHVARFTFSDPRDSYTPPCVSEQQRGKPLSVFRIASSTPPSQLLSAALGRAWWSTRRSQDVTKRDIFAVLINGVYRRRVITVNRKQVGICNRRKDDGRHYNVRAFRICDRNHLVCNYGVAIQKQFGSQFTIIRQFNFADNSDSRSIVFHGRSGANVRSGWKGDDECDALVSWRPAAGNGEQGSKQARYGE